jgi:hypothetical protein
VPRHVARLVIDYFDYAARPVASARRGLVTRPVVDYFASAARPGASAHRAARCRLLRLRRVSGCFGTSHGSSLRSSSSTSPRVGSSLTTSPTPCVRVPQHVVWLVSPLAVDYFAYAVRPGSSARRAACYTARRRLLLAPRLRLAATLALLRVRRTPPRRRLPVASRRPFISTSFPN